MCALLLALMKILWCGIFIKRIVCIVIVIVFYSFQLIDCRSHCSLFLQKQLKLYLMLTKKVDVLQDRTIIKGVSSFVAHSTWSCSVKRSGQANATG